MPGLIQKLKEDTSNPTTKKPVLKDYMSKSIKNTTLVAMANVLQFIGFV